MIERRLLINYRVDPEVAAALLPAPLRPQIVRGSAVAGICLIRLGSLRPSRFPAVTGLRTENVAHRIAVEWDAGPGEPTRTGVFIPRRHTASRPTVWFGGRLFPGVHGFARFTVQEQPNREGGQDEYHVGFQSRDGIRSDGEIRLTVTDQWPGSALFADLDEASTFFRLGSAGYSPTRCPSRLEGMELSTTAWRVQAGLITRATSSFFDNPQVFPAGSAHLDTALVMRNVPVTWRKLPPLGAGPKHRDRQPEVARELGSC